MRKLLAVTAIIVFAACGSDDDDDEATATTVSTSTTVLSTTTTARPVAATTTTVFVARMPELAADLLYKAWRRGDRPAAREIADAAVVDELFKRPVNGPEPSFEGCTQQAQGRFECAYRYEGSAMFFKVETAPNGGWRVTGLRFTAD